MNSTPQSSDDARDPEPPKGEAPRESVESEQPVVAEAVESGLPPILSDTIEDPASSPPLGIIHLMLWTAGSAVIMAFWRTYLDLDGNEKQTLVDWFHLGSILVGSILYGVPVASVFLWIGRRWQGIRFPAAPGHWILVTLGMNILISFTIWNLHHLLVGRENWNPFALAVCSTLDALSMLIVMSVAAFRVQGPARWPFFFAAWGIINWWTTGFELLRWYDWGASVFSLCASAALLSILLAFVVVRDLRDRNRHDWLHRTGLLAAFLYWGFVAVQRVGFWVLFTFFQ